MPGKRLCCLIKSVSAKLQFAMKTKVKMRPFEIMSSGQKNQRWSCLATVTVNCKYSACEKKVILPVELGDGTVLV